MYELLKIPLEIVRIITHQPEGDNGPCHMWTCPLTTRCVGAIVERIFELTNHLSSLHEIIAIIQGFPLATTRGMDGVFQYLCHDLCCIVCWIKWFRPAGRNIQLQTVYSTVQNPNLLRLLRESFARNQQHTQATSLLHWLDKTPPARNMNFAAKVPSRSCKSNYSTTRAELAQ